MGKIIGEATVDKTIRVPPKRKMSYEEFLDWCDEDTWAEWVDGEVVMLSPASNRHQDLARFLTVVLSNFCEVRGLGVVRPAPFQMKLSGRPSGREPDIIFIAKEHLGRLRESYLEGPADLVVEIVSPGTAEVDRGDKYLEYEAGGVGEYWLIDHEERQVSFYQLGEDGRYHLVMPDIEGVYRSKVLPGFWLRVGWLWEDSLRRPEEVLLEIIGGGYIRDLARLAAQAGGEEYAREGLVGLREVLGPGVLRRLLDEVLGGRGEDEG